MIDDHYKYILHLLTIGYAPKGFNTTQKKQLVVKHADFQLIIGKLYKMGQDVIVRHFSLEHE